MYLKQKTQTVCKTNVTPAPLYSPLSTQPSLSSALSFHSKETNEQLLFKIKNTLGFRGCFSSIFHYNRVVHLSNDSSHPAFLITLVRIGGEISYLWDKNSLLNISITIARGQSLPNCWVCYPHL